MNRTTLPIHEIIVENRQRQDYGDIEDLASSLKRLGQIQPIVVTQNTPHQLVAGGRRLRAAQSLGWTEILVCFKEVLSQDELHELELEENIRRKEMTWQERCLNIRTIHLLKQKRSALEGSSWGMRETAEMLGVKGHSNIKYALNVADLILAKDQEIISCEGLTEAWRLILRRGEASIMAELASRSAAQSAAFNSISSPSSLAGFGQSNGNIIAPLSPSPQIEKDAARLQYLSNPHNPPEDFASYYEEKEKFRSIKEQHRQTIYLSKMLFHCDSIELMLSNPEKFDAIITDIPYGIDMDMLNQGNDGHAFQDIKTVLAEHTVSGNESLFTRFFPAAYHTLKDNTFLITWCDMWQWRAMADLALAAGFKVQRWPITWLKSHTCMNQSANTNFTKTTEVALVCRKGTPTLCRTNIPAHILAGHDEMKDQIDHPFVKPFVVWSHLIDAVTLEGQHILEPFVGRGSGLLSMLRKKRSVTACEINIEHFNSLIENTKQWYLSQNPNLLFA